jgi:hypothetical protein
LALSPDVFDLERRERPVGIAPQMVDQEIPGN